MFLLELALMSWSPGAPEGVRVLTSCALVEPPGLAQCPTSRRCPDRSRELLNAHVERIIRGEVRLADLVLAVRVSRGERDDLVEAVLGDHGELRRHADRRDVRPVTAYRVMNRCRRLAAIDDLHVLDPSEPASAIRQVHHLDLRGGDGDPVVVGEKAAWLLEDRAADPLIHLAACLEKGAHVELQESRPVLCIDRVEDVSGKDREEGLILTVIGGRDETRNWLAEALDEVDLDGFAPPAGRDEPMQSSDIPDVKRDL